MVPLDGDRGGGVVDPLHDRAGPGGADLAVLARAGSVQAPGIGRQAGHHPGDLAGLEVAVHLSGREDRGRQRDQVPGQHPAELRDHLRYGDECVLHPASGQHDLLDGGDGDQAPPDRQRAG
ncbi:hypothetical protein D3C72_1586300 [compost metagenome]